MMEVVFFMRRLRLFVQDRRRVKNILLRVYRLQPNLGNVFLSFTGPVGEALRLHVYMYPASTFIIDKRVFLSEYPNYMKEMFGLCSVNYKLRGSNIFDLPKPRTTTYGLNSLILDIYLQNCGIPS